MSGPAQEIITCLDPACNVLVEACAGSGKTWLLTSRIIRALIADANLEPAQILAITFTNAAAAEISGRVQERLREMRSASDELLDGLLRQMHLTPSPNLRKVARGLYLRMEMRRPRMQVSTFHGWFMQMQNALPWSARTSVKQHVVSNDQLVRDDAWQSFVEEAASANADSEQAAALQAMLVRHKPNSLQEMLDTLLEKRVAWEIHFGLPPTDEGACARFLEEVRKANQPDCPPPEEIVADKRIWQCMEVLQGTEPLGKASKTAQKLVDAVDVALEERNLETLAGDFKKALLTNNGELRKHLERPFAHVSLLLLEMVDFMAQITAWEKWRRIEAYNREAIVLGRAYATHYERRKRELGGCDFADIELTALRALRDPQQAQEVAQRLNRTYRHILIDEFQDTSPGQWEAMRNWLEACHGGDHQPSVFIVGDPKQSIYGFQGGDPEVLRVAVRFLREHYEGKHVRFNTTRRCAQPVVDVVNEVFAENKGIAFLDGFEDHATLQAQLPGCIMALDLVEQEEDSSDEGRKGSFRDPLEEPLEEEKASPAAQEGAQMAKLLREIIGIWEIIDEQGNPRPCRPGDIMLLYPSSSSAAEVVQELARADIACIAPKSKNRLHDLECQDMMAMLRAIYDPSNGYSVARLLRSPVFDIDESDLQAVATNARKAGWFIGLKKAQGSENLREAKKMLARWRSQYLHGKLPAHETLAACYHDADIVSKYVRAVPKELTKRVVENLEWVLNYAIESDGGMHVQLAEYADFLQRLSGLQSFGTREKAIKSDDAVIATTVHGAKGLESPVVVVSNSFALLRPEATAGLLVGWKNDEEKGVRRPDHISFFWYRDTATQAQNECLERNEQSRFRDSNNLFYVALTRAKQALVVSAKVSRARTLEWHDEVQKALARLDAKRQGNKLSLGEIPHVVSTGAYSQEAQEEVLDLSMVKPTGVVLSPPTPQMRHGTMLHDILVLVLAGVTSKQEQASFLGVSDAKLEQLREQSKQILAGKKFADLLARQTDLEMELPIVSADNEPMRIDCVLGTKDEVWVLDFKSAQEPDVERYRDQLHGYRDALLASGEKRQLRMGLVGGSGGLVEVS